MRKKQITATVLSLFMVLGSSCSIPACTTVYIGSNQTDNGQILFGRSEDYSIDYPKTFDVYPAGNHKEGEQYQGCYGFSWTFTHDSYSYSAFSDDNSEGICPDCGGDHLHTPYQAGGSNEKGLTITATETLYCREDALAADPFPENSIEEAEITTILLSEADSARTALDLLISIIEEDGSANGAGILFIDREESWLFENFTGTQYLAVKLNPDMVLINPNLSALGRIDLDDTEHVIASDQLIETALKAGSFVGDEKENVIDFAESFEESPNEDRAARMCVGLNYLTDSEKYQADEAGLLYERSAYTITNVDDDGNIVPLHTDISLPEKFDLEKAMGFYHQDRIAKTRNAETHIFAISPEDKSETGITEWISMADGISNVFFPFYPLLTKEVSSVLSVGRGQAVSSEDKPESGLYFINDDLYTSFPENWDQTMYWPFDYLGHVCRDDEETASAVRQELDDLQAEILGDWEEIVEKVGSAAEDAEEIATGSSMEITESVYAKALELCRRNGPAAGTE